MGITLKATAYNNADWNMQLQVNDADTGGGGAHNNVQKTVLGSFFRKL